MTTSLTRTGDGYREKELDLQQYEQLDVFAHQCLSFKERVIRRLVWGKDEYGDPVQREELELCGMEVFRKGDIGEHLLDSLQRPARPMHTIMHLTRLAQHLPYGRGEEGFQMVLEDIAKDLQGVSEYAIIKTCERFRLDPDLTFFPATALLVKYAKDIDWSLRNLEAEKPPKPATLPPPSRSNRSPKQRIHSARMMKLVAKQLLPGSKLDRWEKKFWDAFNKRAYAEAHQPRGRNDVKD